MTTVNAISAANAQVSAATGKSMSNLGLNDFIALLTTQLKYQDPTKPQDASAFVAQLAQFSSVSGIQEMNSSLSTLVSQLRNSQALNATNLVGHDVLVQTDSATHQAGESLSGTVDVPDGASSLTMVVSDASGQQIRQFPVAVTSGTAAFTWDGLDDSGAAAAAGRYTVKAVANVYGASQSPSTYLRTQVTSVTIDPTDSSLSLNTHSLGAVQLADVHQVI